MRMRLAWLLLLPLGLALGCNGDDDDPDTNPPAGDDDDDDVPPGDDDDDTPLDQARVRVLNLSDDLGVADVFVERIDSADDSLDLIERAANEVVVFEALAVAETSPYLAVASGSREIELYPTGTDTLAFELDAMLAADMDHTVVVWGTLPDLDSLVIEDDDSTVPPDAIALEVINLNEDGTPMTVFDASAPVEPASVVLLAAISPDGETIAAGTSVRIEIEADVTALGIDLDGDALVDFEFDVPADLQLGALHHLALRQDGMGGMDAFLVDPSGDTQEIEPAPSVPGPLAEVRLANLSPALAVADILLERRPLDGADVPLLDRLLADVVRIDGMGDFEATPYFEVTAGSRDLEAYLEAEVLPLLDVEVALTEGEQHTVFLYGDVPAVDALTVPVDDDAITAGQVALQISNLAADLGVDVDLLDLSGGGSVLLADDLALEGTLRVEVAPDVTTLGIDLTDDGTAEYTFDVSASLDADEHVHLVIGDDALDVPFLFLVEQDSATSVVSPL